MPLKRQNTKPHKRKGINKIVFSDFLCFRVRQQTDGRKRQFRDYLKLKFKTTSHEIYT